MKIIYHPKFKKQYKKLPKHIKIFVKQKGKKFRDNPFDKSLKTHKLHGKLDGFYAFRIDYEYRIIFKFVDEQTVLLYQIGTHQIY